MAETSFYQDVVARLPEQAAWPAACSLWQGAEGVAPARLTAWSRRHRHLHPYREILVCLSGETWYGWGDGLQHCPPGQVLFFAPQESHDLGYPPFVGPLEHLWLSVLPERVLGRLVVVTPEQRQFSARAGWVLEEPQPRAGLLATWAALEAAPELPAPLRRLKLMSALALTLARLAEQELLAGRAAPETVQRLAIEAVCRHLDETAGRGATLATLARLAGYSKYHFLRLFKARTGLTVHGYIEQCRRRRLRELLEQGYSRQAIGRELGFASAPSFSRWCRQSGGVLDSA